MDLQCTPEAQHKAMWQARKINARADDGLTSVSIAVGRLDVTLYQGAEIDDTRRTTQLYWRDDDNPKFTVRCILMTAASDK